MIKYAVLVAQTIGKALEKSLFDDLSSARKHYQDIFSYTSHERVLILLLEKPASGGESIIDVDFKDGISYNTGKVGSSANRAGSRADYD
jgi:hypothetical protein